jgi:hypothetical protein
LISRLKRALHERKAQKTKESPQDRAARLTANATIAIAFFTAVTVVVGALQWSALSGTDEKIAQQVGVMRGQLNEMRTAREGSDKSTADQLKILDNDLGSD